MTPHSTVAILATLTSFLDESRGLSVSQTVEGPHAEKTGRPPAGARAACDAVFYPAADLLASCKSVHHGFCRSGPLRGRVTLPSC
jgi:hypothetical protein